MKAAALIALVLLGTPAAAFPIMISDVTSIAAGESITFSVVIPYSDLPDPTILQPAGSSTIIFYSGDGQTQQTWLASFGSFPVTFTYLTPGDYVASALGNLFYHSVICINGSCIGLPNGGAVGTQVVAVTENITVVPEPATWALLLFGFAFFAMKNIWPTSPENDH